MAQPQAAAQQWAPAQPAAQQWATAAQPAAAQPAAAPAKRYASNPNQAKSGAGRLRHNYLIVAVVSGTIGGLIGGIIKSVVENNWFFLGTFNTAHLYLLYGFLGLLAGPPIGFVVASWGDWTSGNWKVQRQAVKSAIFSGVGGYVGFVVGSYLASKLHLNDGLGGHNYIARMIFLACIGAGIGTGLAASYGIKSKRVLNGLIGGTVGGAVAGLLLQFISAVLWTSMPNWIFDILEVLPVAIGVALGTSIVERVFRESWIRITAGPMSGKEFTLFKPETRIGADYRCDIVMARDPQVRPFHAAFLRDGSGKVTVAPFEGAQINLNGMPSAGGSLRNFDAVIIGSSVLTYQEKAVQR
jgi:MFS family permease